MAWPELRRWWRVVRISTIAGGTVVSFLAAVEVLRAYTTLHEVHPVLGAAFLGTLATLGIAGLCYGLWVSHAYPAALSPPPPLDGSSASRGEVRAHQRYLSRYALRLQRNPALSADERTAAAVSASDLLRVDAGAGDAAAALDGLVERALRPLIVRLDEQAHAEIQRCVRDVMAGVTLNPYRAADLGIVLYRVGAMVLRIARIYNTRPSLREQAAILGDVLAVVATVNFVNLGSRFVEQLLSRVPYVGLIVDDIAQGIGAGVLTSAAGHAAMDRCRAFHGWSRAASAATVSDRLDDFLGDVKRIFRGTVLPMLRPRVPVDVWSAVTGAFEKAGNLVGGMMRESALLRNRSESPAPADPAAPATQPTRPHL